MRGHAQSARGPARQGHSTPDMFVALGSGHDPATEGARLYHNDDAYGYSGLGLHRRDSRIAAEYLPAGDYTVEATTYSTHTTADYRLTIDVDHTPRVAAHPTTLDADVGVELTEIWRYQPGAATAAITSTLPDGITATVNAAHGLATLVATAAKAGTYPIDITYTNGTQTHTATTTITATCPTTHTQTPTGSCAIPAHCVHSMQASSDTMWAQRWGKQEYSGNWRNACLPRSASGTKSVYFHIDVSVPNPAESTLPVQFWLTTRPADVMFLYQGADPSTASPVNVGNTPVNLIENSRVYALPPGDYILETGLQENYDALEDNAFMFFVQLPSPEKQYFEVKRLSATQQVAGVVTLDGFLETGRSNQVQFPYLSWGHDGCSNVPDSWDFKLWREVAYLQWRLVETRTVPAQTNAPGSTRSSRPTRGSKQPGTRSASCTASISPRTAKAPSKRSTGSPTSTAPATYPSSATSSTPSSPGIPRSSTGTKPASPATAASKAPTTPTRVLRRKAHGFTNYTNFEARGTLIA